MPQGLIDFSQAALVLDDLSSIPPSAVASHDLNDYAFLIGSPLMHMVPG
ncbi:unnamed protein product [Strongylus vulgaris]|uniref:Uncharacterized protein n=1 Tax=Strongylus vulgaris TaxID=40348 RepID=A0A3P7LHR4_STRVU|nr:unnamed protein product [Strongylus vulgaris]